MHKFGKHKFLSTIDVDEYVYEFVVSFVKSGSDDFSSSIIEFEKSVNDLGYTLDVKAVIELFEQIKPVFGNK